jgi:hypothetical protein
MKRTSLRSGPRESNAGDDFHILWAASQAIQLLNPRSGLRRIFVEKLSPTDESPVETKDDLFLGADVAEYFGGDDFCSAARVVVAQLKYSTRHSTRAWTVSRLAQLNRGASVIQRLAAIFKGFANIHARPDVTQKLKIRLVSNQPAADSLQVALDEAQRLLKNQSLTPPTLFAQLKPAQRKAITTLSKQAGLDESEFLDFLRVFDLSGCGEASRHRRRSDLLKQLAPQVSNDPATMLRSLCDLIRSEALPERTDSAGLTEHDVLAALNVPIKENLFPAPAHFQTVTYLIETPDAVDLAKTIVSSKQGRKILAHGNAGAGKTTTVQHVAQQLPPGSIVLTYDCFGGGDYKVPGSQRHTQSRAFLQLTNEMAVHCGTPFLLRPAHETADLQRDFRRALDVASRIVALDHGGLLVIFIDAADNAVLAAEGERDCFVPIFWQIPFPENCRLVMTCRTHRRASLGATQEVVEYALRGFDETASAAHLRTLYTNANVEACERFHRLTGGNPRMQAYLLEHARDEALPLTQLFVGKRKTLEDLFHDLLESAVSHSPARVNSQELLADLICLMRPAPPAMLADVHDLTPEKHWLSVILLSQGYTWKMAQFGFVMKISKLSYASS